MFSHVILGADDIAEAKRFYDAVLGVLGVPEGVVDEWGRVFYAHAGGRFGITRPINGEPASFGNGSTLGFLAASPEQADAWQAAGVAHGGTAIEDPPGVRHATGGRLLYLAYLRDPWGNKLCALHRIG
ncbi:VOC family protein [Sphingomonas carotinifaciens]|uniref:Catechol 2,3-dioxygenase n=1 Tax=Sphingomonas carotinifaciens TaxID=1166323 RepID=A0A1G7K805_9SPHN|nr:MULTISPECIES: VOC family protein [Sphingomonas]MBB4085164.1 catechol 2,3-dioxygenase-like lactoylglutathione lyase family enzyme [Sphingomonas carotinifaciens]MWC43807.1 VOC family protein [Sphingomonas carotinifaciens]SDF33151.1 Catechol 2,3-dioxygenase [Sphingomonas carotinifaciens]